MRMRLITVRSLVTGLFLLAAAASHPAMRASAPKLAPDDSPAARDAAIARLRGAPAREVCVDPSPGSRNYGTTCVTREFPAPAILVPPKIAWMVRPGWWGTWSPYLIGDLVLTGSCNNEDNKGLSAFDMKTGRTAWRIASICDEGNRAGSTGSVRFHGLSAREVLMIYGRNDGKPDDFYVVDVTAGRIVRSLAPARRGPTVGYPGGFTVLTQSTPEGTSYLNFFSPDMTRLLWRHSGIHLACDKLDPHCRPVFSGAAVQDGRLYISVTTKDQPAPPTRQLHAFDIATGTLLWKHTQQPVVEQDRTAQGLLEYRSDDGLPMVAGEKVVIRVDGTLGPAGRREPPTSTALRALDARTGAIVWTTAGVPRRLSTSASGAAARDTQELKNRLVAGGILVAELAGTAAKELIGYRLSDGQVEWRRPVSLHATLTASSGGAFYIAESVKGAGGEAEYEMQGFDGATGTRLWTTRFPGHNVPFLNAWDLEGPVSNMYQGPSWRIGRDGAIYGVTLQGAYKLQ